MKYDELNSIELVLTCLRTGEEAAWTEFIRRFQPLIASVVIRISRRWDQNSPELMHDLIQETYLKICLNRTDLLKNFQATHADAVFGFIKVFTANLVHDHFKAIHAQKRGGGTLTEATDDRTTFAAQGSYCSDLGSIERAALLREIDACLREGDDGPNALRDRRIFWLYYRVGLPASEIAALPHMGLSTKGVESTILRMTRLLRRKLASTSGSAKSESIPDEGIQPAESL